MGSPSSIIAFLFILSTIICSSYCNNNSLIFSTKECNLTEPLYGHTFDFNALHSELAHVVTSNEDDTFEFNVCGNLSHACDGQNNVAACLKRKGKEYILGRQHALHYQNGKMFFEFSNGSKCRGDVEYKLHVVIGCDYTIDKNPFSVTSYSSDACSFYITFETPLACLPEPNEAKDNNCSVKDSQSGHNYDLLSLSDVNYRTIDRKGSSFVLNVCKPVLYGENAMCPPGSSICFLHKNKDNKTEYINYGTVQTKPTFENGIIMMTHTSNTKCMESKNYSSIVYFTCNKDVKNVHPEFVGVNECIYKFSFATPLACNDLPPCTVITHNGEILDMNPLKDKPFTLSLENKDYTFAVCSSAGTPCLDNDGACITSGSQSNSLGMWNANLRFNRSGTPYLLYENGAECQPKAQAGATSTTAAATYWSTKIEFVCANNATKDNATNSKTSTTLGPKIIENSNCQLLIHYQTPSACQEQIACKIKVGVDHSEDGTGIEEVDLTPLISATDNYEAKIELSSSTEQQKIGKSTKFYLNVCRPLVPKFGLGCPGGSAACMFKAGAITPEDEQSLGYPQASLVSVNRTNVQLGYFHGDPCPTDKKTQMSSNIEFYCDMHAGRGTPVLRSLSDCHYRFVWATNIICPAHMCNFDAQTCEIINAEIGVKHNLMKASYTENGLIKFKRDGHDFTLNLCNSHHKAVTDYSQGLVNVFFTMQGPCSNGNVNVQMRIICSNEEKREISFSNKMQCSLFIEQRTPDICKFLSLDVPPVANGSITTTPATAQVPTTKTTTITTTTTKAATTITTEKPINNHPAERTASIGTILAAILSLTFFVACAGLFAFSPERRASFTRLLRRSSSSVRYSRVQSNEEANLLLEPNGAFTDSDDDMLL